MRKYRVWTDQANADIYEVEAESENEAREKVRKQWRIDNPPMISDIKEIKVVGK